MAKFPVESVTGLPEMGPFVENEELTAQQLNELYPLLQYPFPERAIQHAPKEETNKQYDQTGIGVQWIVNRFNEVLGPSHWRMYFQNEKSGTGTTSKGKPTITHYAECIIEIGNWKDGEFIRIAQTPPSAGGQSSSGTADAVKGARTSAIKKAASFFGVGRQAYEGTLDDDYKPDESGNGQPQGQYQQRSQNQGRSQQRTQSQGQGQRQQTQGQGQQRTQNQAQGQNQGQQRQQTQRQGQPPAQNQTQGQAQGQPLQTPPPNIFTGRVMLTGNPDIGVENTDKGEMPYCKILGKAHDGRQVVVEGWGADMLPLLTDLGQGQVLNIQGARTAVNNANGLLRIGLNQKNFAVATAGAA